MNHQLKNKLSSLFIDIHKDPRHLSVFFEALKCHEVVVIQGMLWSSLYTET